MVTITTNSHGTLSIHLDGEHVADCSTFRRVRGFWNRLTSEWVAAKDLTPRMAKREPARVLGYLAATGTVLPASAVAQWVE